MALSEKTREMALEIVSRYPQSRSALLPMLHLVQAEEGYVTAEGVEMCSDVLGITKAEVGAVATFYTMYKRRPTGEHLVSVCTNTLCGFLGGDAIYQALSDYLGVGHDQTTADGTITLEHAECLAACDYAPVVTVNYEFFDQQTVQSATELVAALQEGAKPAPTRGGRLTSFRDAELELAGFGDRDVLREKLESHDVLESTLRGVALAQERNEVAPQADFDTAIPPVPPKEEAKS
ncbi:NADH-quinone oxidoreductase subunit NuoE [Epidermidibacterium keratini]|uniref:NADH-quinone oxidoreductase subunit NuoE n=1 Tax=Epidermidibacterium keratini TaxID=1891644 RepID=A0A7L4YLK2_9ACTN|nr:NADH-quinone oxidoreductase subunit NuoE [Epidermidibacterium keratini]QHB99752.1 NADH-quinone oxidoreductase subunit NuoE [Epidermidibacterium keratini]